MLLDGWTWGEESVKLLGPVLYHKNPLAEIKSRWLEKATSNSTLDQVILESVRPDYVVEKPNAS